LDGREGEWTLCQFLAEDEPNIKLTEFSKMKKKTQLEEIKESRHSLISILPFNLSLIDLAE